MEEFIHIIKRIPGRKVLMRASLITLGRVSSPASGYDTSADAIANYISSVANLIQHLIGLCIGISSVTIWKTPALLAQRWLISAG